jgi:hypothetical protein
MYIHFYDTRNFYGKDKISFIISDKFWDNDSFYIDDKHREIISELVDNEYDSIDDFKEELKKLNLYEYII